MEVQGVGFVRGEKMERGHIYSCDFPQGASLLEWIDWNSQSSENHLVFLSRLPHRRLLEHIDIAKVETYWMTHRVGQAHIAPDLDALHDLIQSRINNHHGQIILEGLEWLVTLHGEAVMLNFIRTLRDDLHRTQWTLLFPLDELAFDSVWLARFHREAPVFELFQQIETHSSSHEEQPVEFEQTPPSIEATNEGLPALVMLNRLPEVGFTKAILRKRILQWRRMGLDVSEVEPALHLADHESYSLYSEVEGKVRRAVELERLLEQKESMLSASELTTSKFRIRQLTGLEEILSLVQSL